MRSIAIGDGVPLKLDGAARTRLREYLINERQQAKDARMSWEKTLRDCLLMYQGTPNDKGWTPFPEAPVTEITEGAAQCDAILSQAEDLIFQVKPPLISRSRKPEFDDTSDAIQDLINVETESGAWNYEPGYKEGLIDGVQLGTMVWYVPWTKTVRVTDVRKVVTFGPKVYSIAPEHFLFPPNSTKDVQTMKWCSMEMAGITRKQLNLMARLNNWTADDTSTADAYSPVRNERMRAAGIAGGEGSEAKNTITISDTFAFFDLFDDGIERDIEVIWNVTSGGILKVMYNRYNSRPFVLECYQDRAHLALGQGVMEMSMGYERMETTIWNNHVWNMMLANTKMYTGPVAAMQEMTGAYPGHYIPNDDGKIETLDMGEVNNSAVQAEAVIASKLKERVGSQNIVAPIKGSNRAPGISTLSLLQQANRRFTHPFNNMRNGGAKVAIQCLYRIQERVRAGDQEVIAKLEKLMGQEKADLIVKLFMASEVELTDALDIQLQASSVSVNRESDRQNMVMLATQIMPLYKQGMEEAAQIKAHPPFPGADKVAQQFADMLNKFWGKILKTFDQISDVRSLQIDLDEIKPVAQQLGMEQIPGQMQGAMTAMNGAGPMQ